MILSPLFSRTRQGYPPSALAGDAPTTPPATAASDAMSVATASAARLGTVGDWWIVMGITPSVLAIDQLSPASRPERASASRSGLLRSSLHGSSPTTGRIGPTSWR